MSEADPFGSGPVDDEFDVEWNNEIEPEGVAEMQLLDVTKDVSKTSGKPMWVWEFRLCDYIEPPGVGAEFKGNTFLVYTSLSANAMWKLEETLGALGCKITPGENKVRFKKAQVVGTMVEATIEHGEYNDQPRAQIGALRRSDKGKQPIESVFEGIAPEGGDDTAPAQSGPTDDNPFG